jgi:two-component system, NarL family, response regulator NreC
MSIRLLLASHYAMVREGIRLLLGPAREIKLVGEADLAEAPQKFSDLQPDVVLVDVPTVAGAIGLWAVSHIVKSSRDARAVVLTNNDDVSYVRSMLGVGVRGYVLQHSSSAELIAALRAAASGDRFIDQQLSDVLVKHHFDGKRKLNRPALTQREADLLRDLARGYTNAQTASHLNLTLRTIETYRARIYRKLHLHNRAELVHYAIAQGLLE